MVVDKIIRDIIQTQAKATERGALSIWTVYDRPKDHPEGFIARQFEITAGRAKATDSRLVGPLESIRHALGSAGLVCLPRHQNDEPHVVESWI